MRDSGWSSPELLVVMFLAAVVMAMSVPMSRGVIDATHVWHAASFASSRFRFARQQAVNRTGFVGVVFDLVNGRWTFRVCLDGNKNGIRRVDIAAGRDRCVEGPYDVATEFRGVALAVDPALPGPDGEPGSPDPIRFGSSNIASFSPAGSCTAGTLFLRSTQGIQYAVRVGNVSGRTRILRYDLGSRRWVVA